MVLPWPSIIAGPATYLGLIVVLHRHGNNIDANDEGDEQVQVVAGAH